MPPLPSSHPYPAYTSASSVVSGVVWASWVGMSTSTASSVTISTTAAIWGNWNQVSYVHGAAAPRKPVSLTEEQREEQRLANLARENARAAEVAARKAEKEESDKRAEALLQAHLSAEQKEQLAREDWFLVDSKSGKKYRINRGRVANIDVLDENDVVVRSLCVHPRDTVPDADTMLSQSLMLKYDEEDLLKMANVHPINHRFRRNPLVQGRAVG